MLLLEDVALIKAKEDTKPLIETSVVLMLNWFRFHSFNRNDRLDKITIGSELNYGNNNVDNQRKKLLGRWKKITEAKCSEIYLDDLEFKDKGIYVGKKGQKATKHPYWDVGTYQILTEDQVKISTANDAQVIYKFSVLVDILIFIDGNGCEFRYQRIE